MMAPTHITIGALSGVLFAKASGQPLTIIYFIVLLIGSLAPDIDGQGSITKPGSILSRFLPGPLIGLFNGIGLTIAGILNFVFGHRGFIHAPLLPAIMIGAGLVSGHTWLMWLGVGYASHLMADFCTKGGIPALSPLLTKKYSLFPVTTGSWVEAVIFTITLCATLMLGFEYLPENTQVALRDLYVSVVYGRESEL